MKTWTPKLNYFFCILTLILVNYAIADDLSEIKSPYSRPLELYCTLHSSGKTLNCYYVNGSSKKPLNDQDLIDFINKATQGAFVTVKSKKGYEREYYLDPNGPEFRNFYKIQKSSNVSMRELGQAKYAVFASIESKVIQISNNLDNKSSPDLVTIDPAYAYLKFKAQLNGLKSENEKLSKSLKTCETADVEKKLETSLQEKKYFSHYLNLLVKTLGEPNSCADSFQLKPNADGTVNFDRLDDLVVLFRQKCLKDPKLAKSEFSDTYESNKKDKLAERGSQACSKIYESGPFVISGGAASDRPFCYGVTSCSHAKEKPERVTVSCLAKQEDGHYVCPPSDRCAQNKDVLIFNKNIELGSQ